MSKRRQIAIPEQAKFSDYVRHAGHSQDWRTNQWSVTCPCGKPYSPPSTMMAAQGATCPKCGTIAILDYNNETIKFKPSEDQP